MRNYGRKITLFYISNYPNHLILNPTKMFFSLECLYVFDVFLLQINEYVLDSYRRQITFCIKRAIDFLRETHHIQYVLEGLSGHKNCA